jgi:hypothetical protein
MRCITNDNFRARSFGRNRVHEQHNHQVLAGRHGQSGRLQLHGNVYGRRAPFRPVPRQPSEIVNAFFKIRVCVCMLCSSTLLSFVLITASNQHNECPKMHVGPRLRWSGVHRFSEFTQCDRALAQSSGAVGGFRSPSSGRLSTRLRLAGNLPSFAISCSICGGMQCPL